MNRREFFAANAVAAVGSVLPEVKPKRFRFKYGPWEHVSCFGPTITITNRIIPSNSRYYIGSARTITITNS